MNDTGEYIVNLKPAIDKLRATLNELDREGHAVVSNEISAKDEVLARYQPIFSIENVDTITEEDFKSFLLFDNNKHWAGLHRQGGFITADMDLLRRALKILVDEQQPIQQRLDQLITRSGPMVPYLGRAVLTGILQVICPEKYGVLNSTAEAGMKEFNAWPIFGRGASFGERYLAINHVLITLAQAVNIDLWTLDALWWMWLHKEPDREEYVEEAGEESLPTVQRFGLERHLHDFLRDNWNYIPDFRDWSLHEVDGDLVGYEYITPIGKIDLLARHRTEPRWLVIELKRSQSNDTTVGQVLRYMGWVADHLVQPGEKVQGLIISGAGDERLHYALKFARDVELMLYEVDFHLRKVRV
jgi:hypothetical protein